MKVVIIYNPNSTGDSEKNALDLAHSLEQADIAVETRKTTHAGHSEEIAAKYAKSDEDIILISSSGDGGYHEVVNGTLAYPTKKFTVGVLPSGNANDHASALRSGSLSESIKNKKITTIDTIQISATVDGKPWKRYVHSYAGIGVTARAAKRLTEDRPNVFSEKWIVLHALFSFQYVKLQENDKKRRYSSIIFANIDRMSKVMKFSEDSSVRDGKFEMSSIRFRSKLRLISYFLTAATIGLKQSQSIKAYAFVPYKKMPIQIDGEVFVIDAGSEVTVTSVKQNLRCVL